MIVNGYSIAPFANLRRADLRGADLHEADLRGVFLVEANLKKANLHKANLKDACLHRANLSKADLSDANLYGIDLGGADLEGANLKGANLSRAELYGTNMTGCTGLNFQIPEGDLIGWKKIDNVLVKLRIPRTAKRTGTPVGRKCRAEFAVVLDVENEEKEVIGGYDSKFVYRKGEMVHPDSYDADWRRECTHGIHFFLTKDEAVAYLSL